ncbi:hypothetical protein AB0O95_02215 [Rhodoglobus sp. NPDC076762]
MGKKKELVRAAIAAASAMLLIPTLASCVQSEAETATEPSATPSSIPSPPIEATPSLPPVAAPFVTPDCEAMVPLDVARGWFHPDIELYRNSDYFERNDGRMPEILTADANATSIEKCLWGIPGSDGMFWMTVADINAADRAAVVAALIEQGAVESAVGEAVLVEVYRETGLGDLFDKHYFGDGFWVQARSNQDWLATNLVDAALEQVRLANPTLTF